MKIIRNQGRKSFNMKEEIKENNRKIIMNLGEKESLKIIKFLKTKH
jgi:hypothetical protein